MISQTVTFISTLSSFFQIPAWTFIRSTPCTMDYNWLDFFCSQAIMVFFFTIRVFYSFISLLLSGCCSTVCAIPPSNFHQISINQSTFPDVSILSPFTHIHFPVPLLHTSFTSSLVHRGDVFTLIPTIPFTARPLHAVPILPPSLT